MRAGAWRWVIGGGLVLMTAYFAVPSTTARDLLYTVIGVASSAAVLIGVRIHKPAERAGWWALGLANVCFVVGDGILSYCEVVLHREAAFPSDADAVYLAGYPFLFFAVTRLVWARRGSGAREARVDASIVTIGSTALLWQFLIGSYAHDSAQSILAKVVAIAYPVMDIGVLFILVSTILAAKLRQPAHAFIAAAMLAMVSADIGYDLLVLHGVYKTGNPVDAGWIIDYVLIAAAALHPSMAANVGKQAIRTETRRRLPLVAGAGFIAPVILLIAALTNSDTDEGILAVISIILFGLVVVRVTWLLSQMHEQALSLQSQTFELRRQALDLGAALGTQQSLQTELRHQAFHDSLTGMANRALFRDRVDHALRSATRGAGTTAVLFCDLDGFKTINDSLGHDIGDELLIVASKRLSSIVRSSDTVARLGGDEFAILMEMVADPQVVTTVAERIVSVLRLPMEVMGQSIRLSASVGISFGEGQKSVEVLLSEADAAMYAAKEAGRNRFESFEQSMRTRIVRAMDLQNSFAEGLRCGEFYLMYQPHFSLHDGTLKGFEALARWRHPIFGEVGPSEFIALAEETGFIVPLGRWVLDVACNAAASWTRRGGRRLSVSVNVSAAQLNDPRLFDDVQAALAYSGIAANQLVLEVTETMLVTDSAKTAEVLKRLKGLGVKVAIDDFGTGYASLSYLREFPVDLIKIDKSFVDPLVDPATEGSAFVRSIIRLAHELNLSTIAEGIEHQVQREVLTALGCDSAQGYLLSKPLTAEDALSLSAGADPSPDKRANGMLTRAS